MFKISYVQKTPLVWGKTTFLGEKSMNRIFYFKKTDSRGFTLIELMVVIVILGILAGLIIPRIMGRPEEAKQVKAKIQIESLETALNLYKLDNGAYPDTEQGLQALIEKPETGRLPKKWRKGGYLEKGRLPKDPWGNDFIYLSPGAHGDYDIISYGYDGVPGGEDKNKDINSWEIEQ
jgi:general secretion pathway protein G